MTGSDRSLFPSPGGSPRRPNPSRRKVRAQTESESTSEFTQNPDSTMSSEDVETLKNQLAETQNQLQDCQAKLSSLQAQLQQVTAHRDELQKALAQLQAVAEERAKTIQELRSSQPLPQSPAEPPSRSLSSLARPPKKILNRPIFDNVSATDEKMPPYLLD